MLIALACGGDRPRGPAGQAAITVRDGAGESTRLATPASRIVSLLPSGAEIVIALGAGRHIVGRTDYDREPELRSVPSVGRGLDPSLERIVSLRPDLVLTWSGDRSGMRSLLATSGIATYALATRDTGDAFRSIADIGRLLARTAAAESLNRAIRVRLDSVRGSVAGRWRPKVLYVVWIHPPITAGPATFVAELIDLAGGAPALPGLRGDWPQVSLEALVRAQPDVVILPSDSVTGRRAAALRAEPMWQGLRAVREGRIVEVADDLVNRPGPRLGDAARALADAIMRGARRERR